MWYPSQTNKRITTGAARSKLAASYLVQPSKESSLTSRILNPAFKLLDSPAQLFLSTCSIKIPSSVGSEEIIGGLLIPPQILKPIFSPARRLNVTDFRPLGCESCRTVTRKFLPLHFKA